MRRTILLGAAATLLCAAAHAQSTGDLIEPQAASTPELPQADLRPGVRRARAAQLAPERLADLVRGEHERGAEFSLPLFDGERIRLAPRAIRTTGPDAHTVVADIEGRPHAYAIIASERGVVAAKLYGPQLGSLRLRRTADGSYRLEQLEPKPGPSCAAQAHAHAAAGVPAGARRVPAPPPPIGASSAIDRFDILVVYTPLARDVSGGTLGIRTRIAAAITEGNLAMTASGVFAELKLVSMAEVDYDEGPGGVETHLDKLTDSEDGPLDVIHIMRNAVGADCVALVTGEDENDGAGVAWVNQDGVQALFFPGMFSVTVEDALEALTLIHELGHNFGCLHDPDNNGGGFFGLNVPPYSVGHRFDGTDGVEYRTIMAYAPGQRIPRFSNPDVDFMGTPTGLPDLGFPGVRGADNRRRINEESAWVRDRKGSVPKLSRTYVSFQSSSWGNGTSSSPYTSLQLAYVKTVPGGEIVLRGTADESIVDLAVPFRFLADQGPVQLGP